MTIEAQDVERAIKDLEAALKDPRNVDYRETIEGALALLRRSLKP